jgi:hypothetical protein
MTQETEYTNLVVDALSDMGDTGRLDMPEAKRLAVELEAEAAP